VRIAAFFEKLPRDRPLLGIAAGIAFFALSSALRWWLGDVSEGFGPMALLPSILLAGLFGGIRVGLAFAALCALAGWVFFFPPYGTFTLATGHKITMAVFILTAGLELYVIRTLNLAIYELSEAREHANTLFRELQHRVSNDFTIVNSLLDLQRRRSADPATRQALEQAMGRIRSVAQVHHHLYTLADIGAIDFRQYLADLCAALAQAAFPPTGLYLRCHCDQAYMPRNRAVAIGLVTNELVTNAVKHAFPDDRPGNIDVRFLKSDAGWSLSVSDDGIGALPQSKPGLGTSLLEEFARQAGGTLSIESGSGTLARLDLPPSAARSSLQDDPDS